MSKVCIGVITKNSGEWLPQVLKNMEMYAKCFDDYESLIVDGHSTDNTLQLSRDWTDLDPNKRQVKLQLSTNAPRPEKLVEARTMIIDTFKDKFGPGVFLLLLDSDSVNGSPLNVEGFMTCFSSSTNWDALFANQPTYYYDVWTLRDKILPHDYQVEWRQSFIGSYPADLSKIIKKYQAPKNPALGFWPVKSAFGGAGLYKTEKMAKIQPKYCCYYADGNQICEHVPFNLALTAQGCELFINCQWMISDHT